MTPSPTWYAAWLGGCLGQAFASLIALAVTHDLRLLPLPGIALVVALAIVLTKASFGPRIKRRDFITRYACSHTSAPPFPPTTFHNGDILSTTITQTTDLCPACATRR